VALTKFQTNERLVSILVKLQTNEQTHDQCLFRHTNYKSVFLRLQ